MKNVPPLGNPSFNPALVLTLMVIIDVIAEYYESTFHDSKRWIPVL